VRLVCLHGDDPVPDELQRGATRLFRNAHEADLRTALTSKPATGDDRPGRQPDIAASATASGSVASARVLLVEDNPVNLMVGQRLLSVLGVDCDTAHNGEAALLRMQASRYDLVLMDCQMPVLDGYTATRRWRDGERAAQDGRHLPIIAMTANAMAGDRQKCIDAGMDDYLAKPVTRAELERCLHRWWRPRPTPIADAPLSALVADAPAADIAATPGPQVAAPATAPSPTQASDMDTVIDQEVLDELRAVLGSEVDRLIAVFLDTTPPLVARLEAAALVPDFHELREVAHSLKSSSANLGAMALPSAAKRVEHGARMRKLDRPVIAVALVAGEYARAAEALRTGIPAALRA
jgi:CheY-like chemotaxis protein